MLLPGTALFALLPVSRFWWLFPAVELVSLGLFALLAPRLAPEPARKEAVLAQTISCNSQDIGALTRRVQDFCADHGADAARQYFAGMAVEEICLAAMEHLFAHRQDGIVQVTVTLCCISGITAPAGTSFPPPTDRKTIRVSRSSAKRPAAFFTAITRASTP